MSDFNKTEYWFESAEYDLQTTEKSLKGLFVSCKPDSGLPYLHKLRRLANLPDISGEMALEQLSLIDTLSPLNIKE